MKTYIFIDGGESFVTQEQYINWISTTAVEWNLAPIATEEKKKRWKSELAKKLIEQGDRVYMPGLPNPQNAKYSEWKLFFDAWIEHIDIKGTLTLIGHSLGGNFLLKYFGENPDFSHSIDAIHLVAACISEGDFTTPENYDTLRSLGYKVHIWHTEDDTVVPFSNAQQLQRELPKAETHFFNSERGYGHFHGIESFPELEDILIKK